MALLDSYQETTEFIEKRLHSLAAGLETEFESLNVTLMPEPPDFTISLPTDSTIGTASEVIDFQGNVTYWSTGALTSFFNPTLR